MKYRNIKILSTVALVFLANFLAAQEIFHRQSFANNQADTQTQHTPNTYNWESYFSSDATRVPGNRITYLMGSTPRTNVNTSTPFGDNIAEGFWLIFDNRDQLAFTEANLLRDPNLQLSMELRNDSASADWHFALRFGDDTWYVSAESYAGESSSWQAFAIDAGSDSLWIPLYFVAGEGMFIAEEIPVTLSTIPGDITAAGFYGDVDVASATRFRIDNFTAGTGLFLPSFPYRQGWSNNTYNNETETGDQFTPNAYGWESYFNSASIGYVARVPGNRITFLTGSRPLANINAPTPNGDAMDRGYWLMAVNVDQLAYAELNIPRNPDLHIGFDVRNDTADANWHVVLRFGDNSWYVSADYYAEESEDWNSFVYPAGSDSLWVPLFYQAQQYMAVSGETPVTLSSIPGDITAAGFYGDINESSITRYRIDNFTVGTSDLFMEPAYFKGPHTLHLTAGFRYNPLGFFYDAEYPYVYMFDREDWIWVHPLSEDPEDSYIFYSYDDQSWYWTGNDVYPDIHTFSE